MLQGVVTLNVAASVPVTSCPSRGQIWLSNTGANPAFIGTGSGVTSGNGMPLAAGASVTVPIGSGQLFAISTTGATTLAYFLGGI